MAEYKIMHFKLKSLQKLNTKLQREKGWHFNFRNVFQRHFCTYYSRLNCEHKAKDILWLKIKRHVCCQIGSYFRFPFRKTQIICELKDKVTFLMESLFRPKCQNVITWSLYTYFRYLILINTVSKWNKNISRF